MKRIEAFKTSDGQLFEVKSLALRHEAEIQWKDGIERLIQGVPYSGSRKMLLDFLRENDERLKQLYATRARDEEEAKKVPDEIIR